MSDFDIQNGILVKYNGPGGDVVIPEGVTEIGERAFEQRFSKERMLRHVTMPDTVTKVGNMAFYCSGLQSIDLSRNLKHIDRYAFVSCDLTEVELPEGLEIIDYSAFNNNKKLVHITLPESLKTIGTSAFEGCLSLTGLEIPAGVEHIGAQAFKFCHGLADENGMVIFRGVLYDYCGEADVVTVPQGVTSVSWRAFCTDAYWNLRKSTVKHITLPEGVKKLEPYALSECPELTGVDLPESLESIGDSAFHRCASLAEIRIPDGVTELGQSAFSDCPNLKTIRFSKNLTALPKYALYKCPKLELVSIPEQMLSSFHHGITDSVSAGLVIYGENGVTFKAYSSKYDRDNLSDLKKSGQWYYYDLDLIQNGPSYKYKMPARLLGMLGRLQDPVDLKDDDRAAMLELLVKNAKKLVPIAETLHCPEIIGLMRRFGILNDKNQKAIHKLLAASPVPEIAACVL